MNSPNRFCVDSFQAAERALELKMARHEVTDLRRLLEHSQALLNQESSRAESHGFPGRSLRATRDHTVASSQAGMTFLAKALDVH
jgi:hypothetical protein